MDTAVIVLMLVDCTLLALRARIRNVREQTLFEGSGDLVVGCDESDGSGGGRVVGGH